MSVIYSNTPENVATATNTPIYQDWGPNPNIVTYYWSNVNVGLLMPQLVNFKIKDFIGVPEFAQYSEFRLHGYTSYMQSIQVQWISPSSYNSIGYPVSYFAPISITENALAYNFLPSFQNLGQLPQGTYEFRHHFSVQGKNSSNTWVEISMYTHTIRLVVSNALVNFSPTSLHFVYAQNTVSPNRSVTINGESWKLWVSPNFELSSDTPGTTVTEFENPYTGQTVKQITGSGLAEVDISLSDYFDNSGIATPQTYQFTVIAGESTIVGYINVLVDILNIGTFYANPEALDFYAVKGVEEPESQNLFVLSAFPPYEFTCSPWLTAQLVTIELVMGVFVEVLKVVPIPTANMEPGIYQGEIVLNDIINDIPSEIIVPVSYNLDGFVSSPYESNKFAFTLDPLFFLFSTLFENTYMQLTATIRVYDYAGLMSEKKIYEKVPTFKGKGKINYGNIIHQLMARFPEPNENTYQYQLANFTLYVEEIDAETIEVKRTALLPEINFVAGLSNRLPNNAGFLELNQNPSRFTVSGFTYLNMLYPEGNHLLRVKLNDDDDTIVEEELPISSGKTILKKIDFSDYSQGDKVEFLLISPLNEVLANKTFYVLPEQKYSWHLVWQSEYLMQSVIQCTGSLSTKSDFEYKTNLVFKNLVEVLDYLETTKTDKLIISTGWILKTQLDEIESLLRSPRVWLFKDDKKIELRPITKSVVIEDKERELIEYNLEFQINRTYDQETYSF